MKQIYLLLLFFFVAFAHAQSDLMPVTIDGNNQVLELTGTAKNIMTDKDNITSFAIAYALPAGYSLSVNGPNGSKIPYSNTDSGIALKFADNLLNTEVQIQLMKGAAPVIGKLWSFRLIKATVTPVAPTNSAGVATGRPVSEFDTYLYNTFRNTDFSVGGNTVTRFGIVDKEGRIHIYVDYRGNNLMTTIPAGISNAEYVVHVISPYNSQDPNPVSYTIKQRSGTFNDALNFRNADLANNYQKQAGETYTDIRDEQFILSTSTDNISFDLVAVSEKDNTVTKTPIESYTINMTPTYHGSFDVGFLQTELTNPAYSLVNSPDGIFQTVKKTSKGDKEGVATIMATFYYSPVIMLESLFGSKKVPPYKLNGRNFLDDHKFYERFYPTVGVGLNDKVFENFFIGVNWEIVRGFAVFYGWNYRKVNTFSMPGFEEGVTPVTEDQFNYYTNEDWKTKPAYGIKMDLLVVMGLFGK